MFCSAGAILFYLNIFAGKFPIRFFPFAGGKGGLINAVRIFTSFLNFVCRDMKIVFFKEQIGIFNGTYLQINVALGIGVHGLVVKFNKIGR